MHDHFCCVLSVISKSLSPAKIQRRGWRGRRHRPLMNESIRICGSILKPLQLDGTVGCGRVVDFFGPSLSMLPWVNDCLRHKTISHSDPLGRVRSHQGCSRFLFYLMGYNVLLSLFWCSNCVWCGQQDPLLAGFCVLLTFLHHSLNTFLLSGTKWSRHILFFSLPQPWNHPSLQGSLVPF